MRNNKREKILLVAEMLMSREGYRGVSFEKIASKVGIHKSTIFHYFRNKEELLNGILDKSYDDVIKNLEEIIGNQALEPEEKLKRAFDNHLTLFVMHFDKAIISLNELRNLSGKKQGLFLQKRRQYQEALEKLVIEMQTKGHFHLLDSKIVTFGILGLLNWVARWFRINGKFTIEDISEIFFKMIVKQEGRGVSSFHKRRS